MSTGALVSAGSGAGEWWASAEEGAGGSRGSMAVCDWLRVHERRRRLQSRMGGVRWRETAHDIGQAESCPQERQDKWLHTVCALKTLGKGLGLGFLHQIQSQGLGALLGTRCRCSQSPITAHSSRRLVESPRPSRRKARQQRPARVGDFVHHRLCSRPPTWQHRSCDAPLPPAPRAAWGRLCEDAKHQQRNWCRRAQTLRQHRGTDEVLTNERSAAATSHCPEQTFGHRRAAARRRAAHGAMCGRGHCSGSASSGCAYVNGLRLSAESHHVPSKHQCPDPCLGTPSLAETLLKRTCGHADLVCRTRLGRHHPAAVQIPASFLHLA